MDLVRRIFLRGFLFAAWLTAALPACAVEATLVADTHVNSALPAVNSGSISNLNVGAGYTALLQFDLSMLPAGITAAQVSKAVLRLYCNRADIPGLVKVQELSAVWGEYSVTYATLPTLAGPVQGIAVSQAGSYVTVDVTALVQGWISAPATNNGLALTSTTASVQFDSKENDLTGHAAVLDVALTSSGPTGATGSAGPAGSPGLAGLPGSPGSPGVAGLQGLPGTMGATGAKGDTGATGPTGPTGSQGGATGAGLNYRGAYNSGTSYGLQDFITYQGSSYLSLSNANTGNLPGVSPSQWALLAAGAVGLPGATGASGSTGPIGLTGATGAAGSMGPGGSSGAAGAAGLPGLVYRGPYGSTTNYALGDVVLWQGSSYTSLSGGNHGNTPNANPVQWGVLTEQGPAGGAGVQGTQGSAGAQGVPGSVGPNGPTGPQGLQGIAGQAGAQGLTGPIGAEGLSGPVGPQGVAGPVGMTFRGAYSSGVNYALAEGVLFGGAGYISLAAGNRGNPPDVSPAQWSLFATGTAGANGPSGSIGLQGTTGPQGLQGLAGPQGIQGTTGLPGPPVANFTGNYLSTTNYGLNDAVSFGGGTYISLLAGNVNNTPSLNPTRWALLVAQGAAGLAGAAGPAGPAGASGPTGAAGTAGPQGPAISFLGGWLVGTTYSVGGAVSYGGASYVALTVNAGREPDLSPAFWGVLAQAGLAGSQGSAGTPGPQGLAGATGVNYRGPWVSGAGYQANDAALFGGTTYLARTSSIASEPDQSPASWGVLAQAGSTGATGPSGAAAAVSVGAVITGAAGTAAAVINSGVAGAAVLNFTIPQGMAGSGGGTSVSSSLSAYHAVSFSNTFYSVGTSSSSVSEADPVLTWVPAGCTVTRLDVYSRQSNAVTVTLRQGLPGAMADTSVLCVVAPGSVCTQMGNVAVAPGNFLDFSVSGAGGTVAAVWTALGCA